MDRIEFSRLLTNEREQANVGKNEMCRKTGYTFVQLQLLEDKPNNFSMDKAFHYLECLGAVIVIYKQRKKYAINSIESVAKWLKKARADISQRTLAEKTGSSNVTIANIERQSTKITIDTFLKILEALGYELKIESI